MSLVKELSIYRCDVCGKENVWSSGFRRKIKMTQNPPADWYVDACSDKCSNDFDGLSKAKQNKLWKDG
jgi:hypothetical protein